MQEIQSTCCYCGVGCGVIIEADDQRIVGVRGDPSHPANRGKLCTKGASLALTQPEGVRALYPELRTERDATRQRVCWDKALDAAAQRFADTIKTHGPDSVAFYISGQLLTEDYYVFNKLARALVGTHNIDTNSRLCMSSAVAGYKATLGADAPPACYDDIDLAERIFITGSNTAYAHPIVYRRIEAAKTRNPNLKIIVVDPRKTDTAANADLHLAILPGTDVALHYAMLHVMLWENMLDEAFISEHTERFAALKRRVAEFTPRVTAGICGIDEKDIVEAAQLFARSKATLSLYCQGLNQSIAGTAKNATLINLHLATGHIGRPGAGPLSLTGQPNAMGGREVGGMATLLPAHRDITSAADRADIAHFWGIESLPETPGKTAVEIFDAAARGEIKALWIACTNPAQSMPNLAKINQALSTVEFVVVQEAFRETETTRFADLLLPATAWGEKEGTVTNSERRITHVNAAIAGPGEARADWRIVTEFAHKLGALLGRTDTERLFPYTTPEAIFAEHCESTRGRDLDITGLSYKLLDTLGPQQWPFPEGAVEGKARLYEDKRFVTPSGRALFFDAPFMPTAEATSARYPFHLNTGRLRDQWHGMSRTGNVAKLYNHAPEPTLEMNRDDMLRRGIADDAIVKVTSRRGSIYVRAQASDAMRSGQTFMAMHWGGRFMSGGGSNSLTTDAVDPVSHQPELKHAAIQIEPATLSWSLAAATVRDPLRCLTQVGPLLADAPYATCGLRGSDNPVFAFRAASERVLEPMIAAIDALCQLETDTTMRYEDVDRDVSKAARADGDRLSAIRLSGETLAFPWIAQSMVSNASLKSLRRWLFAPVARVPNAPDTGRIVCNCFNVSAPALDEAINAGSSFEALQSALKCGTECGSCVPEIKRMLSRHTWSQGSHR